MNTIYAFRQVGKEKVEVVKIRIHDDVNKKIKELVDAAIRGDDNAWRRITDILDAYESLLRCCEKCAAAASKRCPRDPSRLIVCQSSCGLEPTKDVLEMMGVRYDIETYTTDISKIDNILPEPKSLEDSMPITSVFLTELVKNIIEILSNSNVHLSEDIEAKLKRIGYKATRTVTKMLDALVCSTLRKIIM